MIKYFCYEFFSYQVSDGGNPAMVSETTLVVSIGDINDNAPFFPAGPYVVPISEVARVGSPVVVIRADDLDLNSEFTYSIIAGNAEDKFYINCKSHMVIFVSLFYHHRSGFLAVCHAFVVCFAACLSLSLC